MGFLLLQWTGLLWEVPAAAHPQNSYLLLQVDTQVSFSFLQAKGEARQDIGVLLVPSF